MNIVTLLTTWNRPAYLAQSLPLIEREAGTLGKLVLVDNGSDNPKTIEMIEEIKPRLDGFLYHPRSRMKLDAHWHCGDAAIAAFNYVTENFKDCTHILKCDDDIFMIEGAWQKIVDAWKDAEGEFQVAACTGIQTINETTVYQRDSFNVVTSPCAAACLYEANDMKRLFCGNIDHQSIRRAGWDWTYSDSYIRKNKPQHKFIATKPSVVYHAGFTGTHTEKSDFNMNYAGSTEGIVT